MRHMRLVVMVLVVGCSQSTTVVGTGQDRTGHTLLHVRSHSPALRLDDATLDINNATCELHPLSSEDVCLNLISVDVVSQPLSPLTTAAVSSHFLSAAATTSTPTSARTRSPTTVDQHQHPT